MLNFLALPGVVTISPDCCAFGSAMKGSLTGLLSVVGGSPDADSQPSDTCPRTGGSENIDQLGIFFSPISPPVLRVT